MNETDTLKGLIEKARRERGASARQLAKQAQDAEFKIVGTTLNAIESGTYKSRPSDETIRAIGWLAGVSDDVAFTAAGRRNPGPPFASELPPGVDDLSPTERRAALTMLRTLVAQRQELNRYEDTDSQTSTALDPAVGSGAFIGASIAALNQILSEADVKTLRRVRGKLAHHPEARGESVALLTGLLGQLLDAVSNPESVNAGWNLVPLRGVSADWSPNQRVAIEEGKAAAANRRDQGDSVDGRLPAPDPAEFLAAQTIDPKDASLRPAEVDDESQDRGSDDPA